VVDSFVVTSKSWRDILMVRSIYLVIIKRFTTASFLAIPASALILHMTNVYPGLIDMGSTITSTAEGIRQPGDRNE
jgi:hypothetical protein